MKNTNRTAAAVIALTVAALAAPTLAHAKRMGGAKSRSISSQHRQGAVHPCGPGRTQGPCSPGGCGGQLRLRLRQPLLPHAARA